MSANLPILSSPAAAATRQVAVSVCIPTYNGAEFLAEAFDSISQQTHRDLEVIVSDDGSTDETIALAQQYGLCGEFPVTVLHHRQSTLAANWNHCVEHASGRYIKYLFQDDLLEPNCIERMVEIADRDSEINLVFSPRNLLLELSGAEDVHCQMIAASCSQLHRGWSDLREIQSGLDLLSDPALILREPLNKVGEPTIVLIRADALRQLGGFRDELKQLVDLEMWWRLMASGKVGFIDEPLSSFRIHPLQASVLNHQSGEATSDDLRFAEIVANSHYFDALAKPSIEHLRSMLSVVIDTPESIVPQSLGRPRKRFGRLRYLPKKFGKSLERIFLPSGRDQASELEKAA